MTNILSEELNIQNQIDTSNRFIQANNAKNSALGVFSNLVNNLSAKTESLKTKFVDRASKTNTSSINKKAFTSLDANKTEKPQIETKTFRVSDDLKKDIKSDNISSKQETKQNVSDDKINNNTIDNSEVNSKYNTKDEFSENDFLSDDTKNVSDDEQKKAEQKENVTLSDINNSSSVELSPVFSSQNQQESQNKEILNDELLSDINAVSETVVDFAQNNENVDENDNSDNSSQVELINQTLKEITKLISSKDLTQDTKEELKEQINNLIQHLQNFEQNEENKNIVSDFKNTLQDILKNIDSKDFDTSFSQELLQQLSSLMLLFQKSDTSQDKQNLSESSDSALQLILNTKEENKTDVKLNTQEVLKEDESLIKADLDVEKKSDDKNIVVLDGNKVQNLPDTKEDGLLQDDSLEKLQDMLNNFADNLNNSDKTIQDDSNSFDILNKIQSKISEISDKIDDYVKTDNLSTEKQRPNVDLVSLEEKIDIVDLKNLDSLKEIQKIDKTQKQQIIETINSLCEKVNNSVLDKEIKDKVNEIAKTVNDSFADGIEVDIESADLNNEIKLNSQIKKDDSFSFSQETELFDTKQNSNENFSFAQKNQENSLKGSIQKNSFANLQNKVDNQAKTDFINKINDEIMIDVEVTSNLSQSGALSVTDEVAKIALDKSSSLSSGNVSLNVVYDSISDNSSLIRNVQFRTLGQSSQNFASNLETSDIMNQVTNKISQFREALNQKITMVLRPNDLGRLSIELTSNQNGLTTNIIAQNEDVRNFIEKNINSLREQLTQAGVSVNSIQIKTMGQEGSTTYEGNQGKQFEQGQDSFSNSSNQQKSNHNRKNNEQNLAQDNYFNNYDLHFNKDFSGVLSNTLSYGLN